MRYSSLFVAVLCLLAASRPVSAADPESLVFLGFHLTNTSLEPTTPDELQRVGKLDGTFTQMLQGSKPYRLVGLPAAEVEILAKGPGVGNCNGCELDVGKRVGATRVAWGEVQKVSNLILNINIYVEDTASGRTTFWKSTDIRNNTDESWHRGVVYLIKNYLLAN